MVDWNRYTLDELRSHVTKQYRHAHGSRPDVMLIEIDGEQAVLKDFSHSDRGFRHLVGPLLVYREVRSLRQLNGLAGIPRLIRRIGSQAFLIEVISGTPASKLRDCGYPQDFYDRLHELLDAMHARGVAHCDLRSSGNTIIDHNMQPWLVDFVASIHQGSRWNLPARWLFSKFATADHDAVLKLKKRLSPELLTEEEQQLMDHPHGAIESLARSIGKGTRSLTRGLLTSRNRKP